MASRSSSGTRAEPALLQDVEALGHRLHHAVLDAVVDHLHEVAGAAGPGVQVALLGARVAPLAAGGGGDVAFARRQRGEDGIEALDDRLLAADHQAVAALEAPHAAGGADVEVVEALCLQLAGAADVVLPEGVAAVDDGVAGREQPGQLADGGLRRGARGQHDPHGARGGERLHEIAHACGRGRAFAREAAARLRIAVVDHAGVPMPHEPAGDVGAHASEPNHADLHGVPPLLPLPMLLQHGERVGVRGRCLIRRLPLTLSLSPRRARRGDCGGILLHPKPL